MPSNDAVEIVRSFDAPRQLVWRLWSEPEHRLRWWGPEGMALSALEMDFREGGEWRIVMSHPSGYDHRVSGRFVTIRAPEQLSFTYVNASDGRETLVELSFADAGGRTEMRFRQSGLATEESRRAHGWGWGSTFDLLAHYLRIVDPQGRPTGPPRIDGVAEDLRAARARWEAEKAGGASEPAHLEARK
jgi:uncharacterized protein YndB with AHSA1/START domain